MNDYRFPSAGKKEYMSLVDTGMKFKHITVKINNFFAYSRQDEKLLRRWKQKRNKEFLLTVGPKMSPKYLTAWHFRKRFPGKILIRYIYIYIYKITKYKGKINFFGNYLIHFFSCSIQQLIGKINL